MPWALKCALGHRPRAVKCALGRGPLGRAPCKTLRTRISLPVTRGVTYQGSIKSSSKTKHFGCFELTLQKQLLRRILENFKSARERLSRYSGKLSPLRMKFRKRKSALQKKARTKNNWHIISRSIQTLKEINTHLRTGQSQLFNFSNLSNCD